jgi:nitrogen-specific signal transduction histidine kinase
VGVTASGGAAGSGADRGVHALVDAVPEPAVAIDGAGKVTAANALARFLLAPAATVAPLTGRPFLDIVRLEPGAIHALNELPTRTSPLELEGEVEGDVGEPRRVVVRLGLPAPWGYLATIRDVADDRRREQIRLTHEKLAAISQLAAGVAHEFNNIMASLYPPSTRSSSPR